jgi:hypothetical protein
MRAYVRERPLVHPASDLGVAGLVKARMVGLLKPRLSGKGRFVSPLWRLQDDPLVHADHVLAVPAMQPPHGRIAARVAHGHSVIAPADEVIRGGHVWNLGRLRIARLGGAGRRNHEHRTPGVVKQGVGDAAEQPGLDRSDAVGAGHDQAGVDLVGDVQDGLPHA